MVIHSVHKTLPSLTQTALLHRCTDRIDRDLLVRFLGIYQSSSPSYILMSSIDACMDTMQKRGGKMFREYTENLEYARKRLSACRHIRLISPQPGEKTKIYDFDKSKILLSTVHSTMNGRELNNLLRKEFHLEMEMEAENYVLALTSAGDRKEGFFRLCEAVEEIDRRESLKDKEEVKTDRIKNPEPKSLMRISHAMDAPSERCTLEESIGRISVEFAYLYPPGIPLIVPGEQITGLFVKNMRRYLEEGFELQGLSDLSGGTVCVLANDVTRAVR